jgi:predicted transposase YbfD/YdcC
MVALIRKMSANISLFILINISFFIDTMGTQKLITDKIIAADYDYILSLKDNHSTLHQQVTNWFKTAQYVGFECLDVSISQRIEKAHHHIENRKVYTLPVSQIPGLVCTLCKISR